jgi:hypothetical protein
MSLIRGWSRNRRTCRETGLGKFPQSKLELYGMDERTVEPLSKRKRAKRKGTSC